MTKSNYISFTVIVMGGIGIFVELLGIVPQHKILSNLFVGIIIVECGIRLFTAWEERG